MRNTYRGNGGNQSEGPPRLLIEGTTIEETIKYHTRTVRQHFNGVREERYDRLFGAGG